MDNLAQIMPLRFRDKLAPVLKNPVIEENQNPGGTTNRASVQGRKPVAFRMHFA